MKVPQISTSATLKGAMELSSSLLHIPSPFPGCDAPTTHKNQAHMTTSNLIPKRAHQPTCTNARMHPRTREDTQRFVEHQKLWSSNRPSVPGPKRTLYKDQLKNAEGPSS